MTSYVGMNQEESSRKFGWTGPFLIDASPKRGKTGQPDTIPGSTLVAGRPTGDSRQTKSPCIFYASSTLATQPHPPIISA